MSNLEQGKIFPNKAICPEQAMRAPDFHVRRYFRPKAHSHAGKLGLSNLHMSAFPNSL